MDSILPVYLHQNRLFVNFAFSHTHTHTHNRFTEQSPKYNFGNLLQNEQLLILSILFPNHIIAAISVPTGQGKLEKVGEFSCRRPVGITTDSTVHFVQYYT